MHASIRSKLGAFARLPLHRLLHDGPRNRRMIAVASINHACVCQVSLQRRSWNGTSVGTCLRFVVTRPSACRDLQPISVSRNAKCRQPSGCKRIWHPCRLVFSLHKYMRYCKTMSASRRPRDADAHQCRDHRLSEAPAATIVLVALGAEGALPVASVSA